MKISFGLVALLVMQLTGCAIQTGRWFDMSGQPFAARVLDPRGNGKRLEAVSSAEHPCDGAKVIYVDEAAGIRQTIIDWDALSPRSRFTLKTEDHPDLAATIKEEGLGCSLVAMQHFDFTDVATKYHYQADAFVRYRLDGKLIRLQVRQLILEKDAQTGEMHLKPENFNFSQWSDLNPLR